MTKLHRRSVACLLWLLPVLAGCSSASPTPAFCDGIDASLGGCAPDRPAFTATTCTEVGLEYGTQLNGRLLQIYRGPELVTGESRAVRASHVMSLTTSLANLHLRRIGIVAACGVDEFLAGAEQDFSPELKAQAGKYLDDGREVDYATWLAALRGLVQIIDMEEDAPTSFSSAPSRPSLGAPSAWLARLVTGAIAMRPT